MKTRTEITTEYAPCLLTKEGRWRPLTTARYRSELEAERYIEIWKKIPGAQGEKCQVKKRTVVVTIEEWQDITKKEAEQ